MAFVLTPIDTGSIDVNGIPYRRDFTFAIFEKDSSGTPTGRMALTAYYAGMPIFIFPFTPFDELINSETTDFFASLSELTDFVVSNINIGGSGIGNNIVLAYKIVAGAPAAPNEKTAGATIQDNAMIGSYTVASMVINNDIYTGLDIDYDNTTGEIGQNPTNPATFQDGYTVIITLIPA